MKNLIGASVAALFLAACGGHAQSPAEGDVAPPAATQADAARISSDNLARHLAILASDEFEGRAPATPGEDRTVAYIQEQFAAAVGVTYATVNRWENGNANPQPLALRRIEEMEREVEAAKKKPGGKKA